MFSGIDNSPDFPGVKIDPAYTTRVVWSESINFGWDLDVGDVNHDGFPDILVGTGSSGGHRAFLFYNSSADPFFTSEAGSTMEGTDYYGISVSIGDFDDDGLRDVAITSLEGSGVLYVYY